MKLAWLAFLLIPVSALATDDDLSKPIEALKEIAKQKDIYQQIDEIRALHDIEDAIIFNTLEEGDD